LRKIYERQQSKTGLHNKNNDERTNFNCPSDKNLKGTGNKEVD
jgi:hypothetical protein